MTNPTLEIRDSTVGGIVPIWIFAIVWNGLVGAGAWLFHPGWPASGPWVPLICLIAAGLVLLSMAVHLTVIRLKFGRSVFELQTPLSVPGGVVTGTIHVPRPFNCQDGIHLRLACFSGAIHRLANSRRVEVDSMVWEELCTLDRISPGTTISQIPVCFRIPPGARPSDNSKIGDQLLWRLEAKAKGGGVNYAAAFLIPVFAGRVPPEIHSIPDPTAALRSNDPARRQVMDRHIHLTALPGGGCQCELAPGRNAGMAGLMAFFGTIFLGGGVFMFTQSPGAGNSVSPVFGVVLILFGMVFCAVGTFCLVGSANIFLGRTTITVRRGMVTVKNTVGMWGRRHELPAADIEDIIVANDGSINNRSTYSVSATRSGTKPLTLCGLIGDKRDAEWLAAEFKKELLAQ